MKKIETAKHANGGGAPDDAFGIEFRREEIGIALRAFQ
jgi:hypothetical protein